MTSQSEAAMRALTALRDEIDRKGGKLYDTPTTRTIRTKAPKGKQPLHWDKVVAWGTDGAKFPQRARSAHKGQRAHIVPKPWNTDIQRNFA